MGPIPKIRLLVAGRHDEFLDDLCRRITTWTTVEIVGWARSGVEAATLADQLDPDLVLVDLEGQDVEGVAAIRQIKLAAAPPVVLALTSHDTPSARRESYAAGADGFVTKSEPEERLRALITKIRPYV